MNYLVYIVFGILPSFIWLLHFLRKDVHPESNRMVLKIFLYGMLATLPAALISIGFDESIFGSLGKSIFRTILYYLIGKAFIEEILKYLVVRDKVLSDSECDEPTDIVLYFIIAALGFAAFENILYLLKYKIFEELGRVVFVSSIRFVGAVFLHALCSGVLGYFLALSFYRPRERIRLIILGFSLATVLHGIFNYGIIRMQENNIWILVPSTIIIGLAIFVSLGLRKLKKMKSVCKIYP